MPNVTAHKSILTSLRVALADGPVNESKTKLLLEQAHSGGDIAELALRKAVMDSDIASQFEPDARKLLAGFVAEQAFAPAGGIPGGSSEPRITCGRDALDAHVRASARQALPMGAPVGPVTALTGESLAGYHAGRELYVQNKFAEAIPQLNKAMAANPNAPNLVLTRGYTLFAMGKYEEALADFRRVALLEPESARGHLWAGETLRLLRDPAGAAEAFRDALMAKQDLDERTFRISAAGALAGAKAPVSVKAAPGQLDALREQYELGLSLFKADKFKEAEEVLSNVLAYKGNFNETSEIMGHAHMVRGHARFRLDKLTNAAVDYVDAQHMLPDLASPKVSLAECCRQLKWNESARAAFDAYSKSKAADVDTKLRTTATKWAAALTPSEADKTPPTPGKTLPVQQTQAAKPVQQAAPVYQSQWAVEPSRTVWQQPHYEQQWVSVQRGWRQVQELRNVYVAGRWVQTQPRWVVQQVQVNGGR